MTVAAAQSTPIQPKYKSLSWTLKIESDAVKVPDIKPDRPLDVVGTFDASFDVPCNTEQTFSYASAAMKQPTLVLVIRLDQATPKDAKPLYVTINGKPRELGMVKQAGVLTCLGTFPDLEVPADSSFKVKNLNGFALKISISVALGVKKSSLNKPTQVTSPAGEEGGDESGDDEGDDEA
jgi:hypothetical protein